MKKFRVIFKIYITKDRLQLKEMIVEAGNKKMASIRALSEISKDKAYSNVYKNIVSIEEVA
ncbi:hypothetical protein [Pseudobutyrivibrio sp.]